MLSAVRRCTAPVLAFGLPSLAVLGGATGLPAQTGTLQAELGSATSLPAPGVEGGAAVYGLGGLTADLVGNRVGLALALHGGLALDDEEGGDFVTGLLRGEAWTGPGTALGLDAEVYGFEIRAPWSYRTGTVAGGPALRLVEGPMRAEVRGRVGTGSSVWEIRPRPGGPVRRREMELWSRGLEAELAVESPGIGGTLEAGVWDTAGGPFRTLGLSLVAGTAAVAVQGEAGLWDTPLGTEWVGGLAILIPVGDRVTVSGAGGRAAPDPLALLEPGDQGGVTVGVRLTRFGGGEPEPLYTVLDGAPGREGVRVRFEVEPPEGGPVEVLGDFTGWEARRMIRGDDGRWTLELDVPPGTHHFGFRVDGVWYVPPGRPGNAPDEWGRINATLVVSGGPSGAPDQER